jgi:hypothetical protein
VKSGTLLSRDLAIVSASRPAIASKWSGSRLYLTQPTALSPGTSAYRWLILISLGQDSRLLRIHSDSLTRTGFAVLSVGDLDGALSVLAVTRVDGAIICHSFSDGEKLAFHEALRRADPGMPILILEPSDDAPNTIAQHAHRLFGPFAA